MTRRRWVKGFERSEAGETLVEVIVALAIMSAAVFMLVQGIASVIALGSVRENQAAVGAVARTVAEALNAIGTTTCSPSNASNLTAAVGAVAIPSNITVATSSVLQGTFSSGVLQFSTNCTTSPTGTDSGTLQVNLSITAAGVNANGTPNSNRFSQTVAVVMGSPRG